MQKQNSANTNCWCCSLSTRTNPTKWHNRTALRLQTSLAGFQLLFYYNHLWSHYQDVCDGSKLNKTRQQNASLIPEGAGRFLGRQESGMSVPLPPALGAPLGWSFVQSAFICSPQDKFRPYSLFTKNNQCTKNQLFISEEKWWVDRHKALTW
jgi:hypothetical protein